MFYILQNESTAARRRVPILLTDSATGTTAQSGVALTNIYAYVNINGGAFIGGTGSVGEAGFGQYYYQFEANEVATLGLAGIHVTAAGCRDYDAIAQIAAFNLYSAGAGGGISAYDVWAFDYINAPGGVVVGSSAERLEETRTEAYAANNNTNTIIGAQYPISDIWQWDSSTNTDPSVGYNLYQLGIGATGYAAGGGITAGDVWSYVDRTITGGIADTVQLVSTPVDITTASMSGIANTVWDFVITGFGQTGSAAVYTTNTLFTAGNIEVYVANQTPQDVWTYSGIEGRTITGGLADTVTTLTNRAGFSITGGTIDVVNDKTGYSLSSSQTFNLTGNITGNVSGSVGSVTNPVDITTASMTGIAGTVWNSLTASYTANDTFGKTVLRSDAGNATGNVTLRSAGGINMVDADIHRIDNDVDAATNLKNALTGIGASWTGNIAGTVLDVVNPVDVSTASMSGIANTVWSTDVSGYASPSAGYDLSNATAGGGITAGDVWSYATRTITGGIADTVTTVSGNVLGSVNSVVTDVPVDEASISADVWSYATRTLTSGGSGISAADVWTYGSRTITGGIADTVTTLTNRSGFAVTGGTVDTVTNGVTVTTNNDKTGYSLSGTQSFNLTGNITGNLSGSVGSVSGNVGGNVVGSVASVTNPVTFDSAQYASIASSVWNAGTRTLTSTGAGISAYDVWNFVLSDTNTAEADLVSAASGGAGISAADVWTYGSRTITGGIADTVTTLTDRSGFAITGGTITTVSDKSGYSLSTAGINAVQSGLSTLTQAQVGTEVDASLSDVGLTTTVTGRIDVAVSSRLASASYTAPPSAASIASSVWSEPVKTITGGTVDTVTNDVNVAETSMTGIAGTVWSYGTRTLTSGAGATAGDVWTYPTRSLTSGAGITVNAATNIINGPYFVKSNVDSQDGTLDVIRGMVQDIQLTVTDAFQNPFDTTALGLLVNIYDQAGTLTTSYATTELYGPAGLVQFTLDTAVTANEGRYNLILSAAGSGNTIKFGPLQTLVRPY